MVVVRHSQTYANTVFCKSVEAVGWHQTPRLGHASKEGGLQRFSNPSRDNPKLGCLRRLGAVGGAIALAFAAVLARVLAAALTLAVILPLTGMLGRIGRVLSQKYTGMRRRGGILGGLCVHTCGGATEKACECSGESKRFCRILHSSNLSWLGRAHRALDVDR